MIKVHQFTTKPRPKLFSLKSSYVFLLVSLNLVGISVWPAVQDVIPDSREPITVNIVQNGFVEAFDSCFSGDRQTMPKAFKLEANESMDKWEAVQRAMESLPAIHLTIWYDFGGLQLYTAQENGKYRMTLRIERELTENEQSESFSCLVDPKQLKIIDLVRTGDKVRNAPPDPLPEPLNTQCTASPK